MVVEVLIRIVRSGAVPPEYQTLLSAGADVRAFLDTPVTIEPAARALIPCGFAMEIPDGYEVQVRPRSGLAFKYGIGLVNAPGTIDADYRGELQVLLMNWGRSPYTINHGDRIAQIVVAPIVQTTFRVVEELRSTARGSGGFGSTGV
jgi:dUTP pyrophosphatase